MPDINISNFSAGWIPGDDPVNGRKTGLLQMENLEFDSNGALTLTGGTVVKTSGYSANAHTLFSRLINGARADYAALSDGTVYRNSSSVASGGDATNAAFGTAFNFTLIASGATRKKDDGTTLVNLGVAPSPNAPTVTFNVSPKAFLADTYASGGINNVVGGNYLGTGFSIAAVSSYVQMTADNKGSWVAQTYNTSPNVGPFDLSIIPNGGGYATDNDYIDLAFYVANPAGRSIQFDVILEPGVATPDQVSNYYTYFIPDLGQLKYLANGVGTIRIRRIAFTRIGNGTQNWSTSYGFRISYKGGFSGETFNIIGSDLSTGIGEPFYMVGGSHTQDGQYQYFQVNVNNTGSYLAKSTASPLSVVATLDMGQSFVTPYSTGMDAQVNEIWIYRTGGNLDKPYRVLVIKTPFAGAYDQFSDQDALTANIFYDFNLVSIAYSALPDKIYDIVGPVNGRWYYFTTNFIYPSDINDPDLVNPSIAVRTCGSSSELFMWARQVNDTTILVGTSVDVYTLSGTFATLPDNTVDIYYRGLKIKYPPLTCDAEVYGGSVYYLGNDGWRLIDSSGGNPSLVSPTLDRLYRGENLEIYQAPNLKVIPRSIRLPLVIAKNKMWCFVTGIASPRLEVYDFIRQYWRVSNYKLGDVTAAAHTQDGQVIAFYSADKKLREIDVQSSKLIDGATKQTVAFKSMVFDGGAPFQRKDSSTVKVRVRNSDSFTPYLFVDTNNFQVNIHSIGVNPNLIETFQDISQMSAVALVKLYQIGFTATVSDFLLTNILIDYDLRPEQRTFVRVLANNFNSGSKKRLRNWPIVIDTIGNFVTLTDYCDNNVVNITTLFSLTKQTLNVFFTTDVFGVDYSYTLQCSNGMFEYFERLAQPEIVQVLPIAKRFDQVGPEEFFRYGKIKMIELRVLPLGGTVIPYTIYFSDAPNYNGSFSVISGVEDSYFIMLPKGTSGHIVRITLGPTNFDFHRYYTRLQVTKSGSDSDLAWINL